MRFISLLAGLLFAVPAAAQIPPGATEIAAYRGLHAAAASGDAAEIARLIGTGEKADAVDSHRRTPLHVAAHLGHQAAAQALLRGAANPNALDAQQYDIVTIAAVNNDVPMLKLALAGGCDPKTITSPYQGTALIGAAHLGHINRPRGSALGFRVKSHACPHASVEHESDRMLLDMIDNHAVGANAFIILEQVHD